MGELSQVELEKVKNVDLSNFDEVFDKYMKELRESSEEVSQPDLGVCNIVYMLDGKPVECGGELILRELRKPFDDFTPIGGPPLPVIDSYAECQKCKIRKSL